MKSMSHVRIQSGLGSLLKAGSKLLLGGLTTGFGLSAGCRGVLGEGEFIQAPGTSSGRVVGRLGRRRGYPGAWHPDPPLLLLHHREMTFFEFLTAPAETRVISVGKSTAWNRANRRPVLQQLFYFWVFLPGSFHPNSRNGRDLSGTCIPKPMPFDTLALYLSLLTLRSVLSSS